jgi:fumarate reductase iron-sulfur subunit
VSQFVSEKEKKMGRTLTFNIFRYNPSDPASSPHMDKFTLDETERMTLFIALNRIREEIDPTLMFDFCCRAGICGACAMVINGRPGLACHTKTKEMPDEITLMPLPVFKLVGDLSVDTGTWFRGMYQKVESWVHTDKKFDPKAQEERMDNALAEQIYELDRCIECGCCVGACGTALMREDFLGAVALNRLARFILDPRDQRTEKDYFDIVGTDEGIFGCMGLLACEDVCPKQIPLQEQLGKLRRKMALAAVKNILPKFLKKDF